VTEHQDSLLSRLFARFCSRRAASRSATSPATELTVGPVGDAGAVSFEDVEQRLRQLCIDTTRLTGQGQTLLEALAVFDCGAGNLVETRVGKESTVAIPASVEPLLYEGDRSFRLVHTHPHGAENVSLSEADVTFLWIYQGLTEIEAVLLDGSCFRASRASAGDWDRDSCFAKTDLINMGLAAADVEYHQNLSDDIFYNEVRTHVVLRALHDFIIEDERKVPYWGRAPRTYGFRYGYALSSERRERWDAPANAELIQKWVKLTVKAFRKY